ncbi:hypothetical protein CXG81DRAFT_27790 [Caulochytrium protostelioides]|uniref:Uncharacterized protein n=1 Tax=Caulochytrium protostelioides TaxID=1555241 RepID=A0A4P9X354_9FUNG|nr:hypothetical protein CXG81DRAFT_27790 [Caulochytrium protostelioides]|eukprot:RKO99445.1 hypothetical protein CXG81DRAFT_27790 [Caulochytrium protostelioides]
MPPHGPFSRARPPPPPPPTDWLAVLAAGQFHRIRLDAVDTAVPSAAREADGDGPPAPADGGAGAGEDEDENAMLYAMLPVPAVARQPPQRGPPRSRPRARGRAPRRGDAGAPPAKRRRHEPADARARRDAREHARPPPPPPPPHRAGRAASATASPPGEVGVITAAPQLRPRGPAEAPPAVPTPSLAAADVVAMVPSQLRRARGRPAA